MATISFTHRRINGFDFNNEFFIKYTYYPPLPEYRDSPAQPAYIEFHSVRVEYIDLLPIIKDEILEALEEELIKEMEDE